MRPVHFIYQAELELLESFEYYNQCEAGLGFRFLDEVERASHEIEKDPLIWRVREKGHRRINLKIFPYYLPFYVEEKEIVVVAVAQANKKPLYWKSRIIHKP